MKSNCHLCGAGPSLPIEGYEELCRVTSDCKSWPSGGHLFLCTTCGTIHKNTDSIWLDEIDRIYGDYDIYHLSGGEEQPVYVPGGADGHGGLASRSKRLLDQLTQAVTLPAHGRLLEIGCGNGSFLKTFSQDFPGWTSVGTEFNDKYKARVESIHNVEKVHTGPVEEVEGEFDMATMIHVLEHIPWPGPLMATLRGKLGAGKLILDLPHHGLNPYDLVVADHCSHFVEDSVRGFLTRQGFSASTVTTQWIRKELVVVAEAAGSHTVTAPDCPAALAQARAAIAYLNSVIQAARDLRGRGACGIFGTSIAGTWLAGALQGDFDFWVEEDPNRLGREYLGKTIYTPQATPAGTSILIALAPQLSGMLRDKFNQTCPQAAWFVPEDWD